MFKNLYLYCKNIRVAFDHKIVLNMGGTSAENHEESETRAPNYCKFCNIKKRQQTNQMYQTSS